MPDDPLETNPEFLARGIPVADLDSYRRFIAPWLERIIATTGVQLDWFTSGAIGGAARVLHLGTADDHARVIAAMTELAGELGEGEIITFYEYAPRS